ncbi:putative membrane protein, partial [Bacteroides fragilis str. DS-208]
MFLYFFIYLFLLFFSLLDFSIKKNREYDILYFLFSCFIFIVAAFRGMGNDYDGYEKI